MRAGVDRAHQGDATPRGTTAGQGRFANDDDTNRQYRKSLDAVSSTRSGP